MLKITNCTFKFAQGCNSRECKKEARSKYEEEISSDPTTPHELDRSNNTVTCLYCGKVTKL